MLFVQPAIQFMNKKIVLLRLLEGKFLRIASMLLTPTTHTVAGGESVEHSCEGHRLVPYKVYPYLLKLLQRLVSTAEFIDAYEHWRRKVCVTSTSHLGDIYDGRV